MTKTTTTNKITARCGACKGPAKTYGKLRHCSTLACGAITKN